jgi:hypothetical protein
MSLASPPSDDEPRLRLVDDCAGVDTCAGPAPKSSDYSGGSKEEFHWGMLRP